MIEALVLQCSARCDKRRADTFLLNQCIKDVALSAHQRRNRRPVAAHLDLLLSVARADEDVLPKSGPGIPPQTIWHLDIAIDAPSIGAISLKFLRR